MEAQKSIVDVSLEQDFIRALRWAMWTAAEIAKSKGFHDNPPSDAECVALVHSELSEILEHLRDKPLTSYDIRTPGFLGVEVEGADVLIRMFDWYWRRGWRLGEAVAAKMRYNETRPRLHGKAF